MKSMSILDDRKILRLAVGVAGDLVDADMDLLEAEAGTAEALIAHLESGHAPAHQLLSYAFLQAMDRLRVESERLEIARTTFGCGWCRAALGGDAAAIAKLATFDDAGIKAHTMQCTNNPLVVAIVEFFSALDETTTELVPESLRRPRLTSAELALREIAITAGNSRIIAEVAALGDTSTPREGWEERAISAFAASTPKPAGAP